MAIIPLTNEQARLIANLEQHYASWIDAERAHRALPYDLRRKQIAGRSYLYEIEDRGGNGRSLGPLTSENDAHLASYRRRKADIKARREGSRAALDQTARLCRTLRVPMLANEAGPILREADRRGLLGSALMVVGTNAMTAYAIEASGFLRAPEETQDFDFAWTAAMPPTERQTVAPLLKAVDPTFTLNSERTFQARNAAAYEVELLVAPSRRATLSPADWPRPVALPEQEWLLLGTPVDRVVICRDASPARIVAPDPRFYALKKLWMADQPKRNALKRPKDRLQATLLLDAIHETMPQYPLDEGFARPLPPPLAPLFAAWRARPRALAMPTW